MEFVWPSEEWKDYLRLTRERPECFQQDERLSIVLDEETVREFVSRTGKKIGVAYRSPYNLMVVDLVRDPAGKVFAYERLLPAVAKGAVVTVPVCEEHYALLRQFRHAIRREQYAFPRGFGEEGLSAEENAAKELEEELGARVLSVRTLGSVAADSGISSTSVVVVACEIDRTVLKKDYEGIQDVVLLSKEDLTRWIVSGRIDDGFTLSAWALLRAEEDAAK